MVMVVVVVTMVLAQFPFHSLIRSLPRSHAHLAIHPSISLPLATSTPRTI